MLVVGLGHGLDHAVPALALERELEAVAGLGVVVEPLDGGIGHGDELLVALDGRQERLGLGDVVAKEAAEAHVVDGLGLPGVDRALLRALAAARALIRVDGDRLAVVGDGTKGADLGADAAVDAGVLHPLDLAAALDAHVVLLGLEAVVLATGHAELELAGQVASEVALVELLGHGVAVDVARGARHAALAAGDGAHARAAATGLHAALGEHGLDLLGVLDVDPRDLDGLAARVVDVAVAVLLGHVGHRAQLLGRHVSTDHAQAQAVVALLLLGHEAALLERGVIDLSHRSLP